MLHDKYLPQYHFSEKHGIEIHRTPAAIYQLIHGFDFSGSVIIRTLFKLRGLTNGKNVDRGFLREHFVELENNLNNELILGLVGQFWKPNGNLQKVTPAEFVSFHRPGFLKATWNFALIQKEPNLSLLETETRIYCMDTKAHTLFSRYWFFIRPFSGLIRKEMLRGVKKKAEEKIIDNTF